MSNVEDHLYRRGVGVMLLNEHRHVFVGRRIDNRDEAWQMPQGGIDEDEEPWPAALRELEEETGIRPKLVEQVAGSLLGSVAQEILWHAECPVVVVPNEAGVERYEDIV